MKLKNGELNIFLSYISPIPLSSRAGRMRNRLKKILIELIQQYDAERQELVKEWSRKDESNTPLTYIDDNGQEVGDIEDMIGFNVEFNNLANEYVYIEENLSNKQMLLSIKETVLSDPKEYAGAESDIWEFCCEKVEEINYEEEGAQSHVGD